MHDFYFTWVNGTGYFTQNWSFQGGGDFFTLMPGQSKTEEEQYDVGDRLSFIVSELQVALALTDKETWVVLTGAPFIILDQSGNKVRVKCTYEG